MDLTLVRDYHGADCEQGVLTVAGARFQTIELPWVPMDGVVCGHPGRSCVPLGTYYLIPHNSEAHPRTWALHNPALAVFSSPADVPPGLANLCRTEILIHIANYARELLGCIGVGTGRDSMNGVRLVTNSRAAMGRIEQLLPWALGHTLIITNASNGAQ